ncbi:hypothetical protein Tco_0364422 [Tanacetum coccineum]
MHSIGKTLAELHAMLKPHEKGIPKKAKTLVVLAIRKGKIQKDKKKPQGAKGKAKRKNKLAYAPKTKIPPPPKRDNPAKDSICQHCKEVGLRRSRKLKHKDLHLYTGNGMRAAVEAIRSFDLILPKASGSHGLLDEHDEVAPMEVEPQNVGVPIRRSARIPQAPDRYGYYVDVEENKETQVLEMVHFEQQDDDLKKKHAKNNEAKMVLYNALPKKEYEIIFMCKTAKDIWQSLLIKHQEESIDSGFARFNTLITSLKALDEGFSSKNYVRKFLRALHPKWRAKVKAIEESGKKERVKSIALKVKKKSSDDETSTSGRDDEEYAMAVRNFKKFFRRKGQFVRQPREENKSFQERDEKKEKSDRKCFRCGDPNNLNGDCLKLSSNKDEKAFIGGSWSDSENDAEDKTNDETYLLAQSSNEVCLRTCLEPDDWIKDSGCSKHMTGNKSLFSTYKAYDGGNVVFGSNLKGKIIGKGRKNSKQPGSSIIAIRADHG